MKIRQLINKVLNKFGLHITTTGTMNQLEALRKTLKQDISTDACTYIVRKAKLKLRKA